MKPIVVVEWDDASMLDRSHWIDGEFPAEPEESLVISVGFLVHKTRKHLMLLQSTSDTQHANPITIPRGCVRYMQQLWSVPALAKPPES